MSLSSDRHWTVCLTFDFDALCVWLGGYPSATPAMLSRGEYGARVGVPRILQLLSAYGISATFFVPGHTAESFPDSVEAILAAPQRHPLPDSVIGKLEDIVHRASEQLPAPGDA